MAFHHPARYPQRFEIQPMVLILLAAMGLLFVSLYLVNQVQNLREEHPALNSAIAQKEMPVFFSKTQGSQSITESAARPLPEDVTVKAALQQLLKGPSTAEKAAGYYSEIPQGTKLLGVSAKGATLTVNLSKEFAEGGGATSVIQRVEEVRNTVKAVDKKHALQFAIEGKPVTTIGGLEVEENIN